MKKDNSYIKAIEFAKNHYENFPVVSFLIPRELRKDVAIIYWFARTADDLADEGIITQNERLANLNKFQQRLDSLLKGEFFNDFDVALAETITNRKLSVENFYCLLKAFKQDVVKKRYDNYSELLEYCKNSANPIGRLILELFNIRNKKAYEFSDNICTALQLTNFYQDVMIDYEKGRIYFPLVEMQTFGVTENMFVKTENTVNLQSLVEFNVKRTRKLFESGRDLLPFLMGRLKIEIKWTISGGEKILDKIEKNHYNVLNERPLLTKKDFLRLFLKSII